MADWSTLHLDLLGEIIRKIEEIEDFAYFPAVCRSWYQAYSMYKCTRRLRPKPCLLLTENTKDNPDCLRKILNVSNNKCYQLKLPETFGARCWGSASGWIVTFDLDLQLYVFNPFTKTRIRLPPWQTMPYTNIADVDDEDTFRTRTLFVTRCTVLKDAQSDQDDFVVLARVGSYKNRLAFARRGDETWTSVVPPPWNEPFQDGNRYASAHAVAGIVCCGARALILYFDGSMGYLDISDLQNLKQPVKAKKYLQRPSNDSVHDKFIGSGKHDIYLVESLGDVLVVHRNKEVPDRVPKGFQEGLYYETTGFDVYRIKLDTEEWERLDRIGDVAIYIGVSESVSVRASGSGICKPNCIYFTDTFEEFWIESEFGGHDMGVFDMVSNKIDKFYKGDDLYSDFCAPMWFVPDI